MVLLTANGKEVLYFSPFEFIRTFTKAHMGKVQPGELAKGALAAESILSFVAGNYTASLLNEESLELL